MPSGRASTTPSKRAMPNGRASTTPSKNTKASKNAKHM